MKRVFICLICALLYCGCLQQKDSFVQERYENVDDYMKARQQLIQAEMGIRFDAGIKLMPGEEEANSKLLRLKQEELFPSRKQLPESGNTSTNRPVPHPEYHETFAKGRNSTRSRSGHGRLPLAD